MGAPTAGNLTVALGAVVGLLVYTAMDLVDCRPCSAAAEPLRRECDSGGHRRSNFGQSPLVNHPMMRAYLIVGAAVSTVVILAVDNVVRLWGVTGSTAPFLFTPGRYCLGPTHIRMFGLLRWGQRSCLCSTRKPPRLLGVFMASAQY
jgi:urea transporter